MRNLIVELLVLGLLGQAVDAQEAIPADEKLLQAQGIGVDGPGLQQYLRQRTLSKEQRDKLAATVQQLGNVSYAARAQASAELIRAGELARPFLVDVLKNSQANLEISRRAELCLRQITDNPEAARTAAVIRLLAQRQPSGAAQTVLDYLPFATDAEVLAAAQNSLNVLAIRDGTPEPAVLAALKDSRPQMRGTAGESLIRAGGLERKSLVEFLLRDPQPQVRFQVALTLVEKRDRTALPELIDLLGALPIGQTWPAEELLHRLAGDGGPDAWLTRGENGAKVQALWKAWWEKNQASVDLARLDEIPRIQGLTVIAHLGKGVAGKIVELGPAKEIRWQIDGLQYPVDAQIIGPNRVLIAEYLGRRITERDFQGKVYWERSVDLPIACQRLSGGRTFIATRRQLLMLDAQGKEVFTRLQQNTSIAAAACAPDGHMYLVTAGGLFHKLDPQGREVKSFQVGPMYALGANLDLLPGGRILVPQYRDHKVVEYDANGKVVWEAKINFPTSAVRLGNGNTLVTTPNQMRVVELDRQGKIVWDYTAESRPLRAQKR